MTPKGSGFTAFLLPRLFNLSLISGLVLCTALDVHVPETIAESIGEENITRLSFSLRHTSRR